MSGLIDYAGVYPPAGLSVAEGMGNYRRYRQGENGWMLGRFVLPVGRLGEVTDEMLAGDELLNFVVVGRGGHDGETWLDNLKEDVVEIEEFVERHVNAYVDVLEVPLPLGVLREGNVDELKILLDQAYELLDQTPYYEVPFMGPFGQGWEEMVKTAVTAIRTHYGVAGFKLRCGGAEAHQVPTSEQVAYGIKLCIDNGIALKCVSGLYRPVRQFDGEKNVKTHGFLNVFGAGLLAEHEDLLRSGVLAVVEEEDAAAFVFDEDGFRWGEWQVPVEAIESIREDTLIGLGSSLFGEVCEGLRGLGDVEEE